METTHYLSLIENSMMQNSWLDYDLKNEVVMDGVRLSGYENIFSVILA